MRLIRETGGRTAYGSVEDRVVLCVVPLRLANTYRWTTCTSYERAITSSHERATARMN